MTKSDRAKMEAKLTIALPIWISGRVLRNIQDFVAREVACAVWAERKAQRDTEEIWASHRRRADEQMIERAQGLGRKRP